MLLFWSTGALQTESNITTLRCFPHVDFTLAGHPGILTDINYATSQFNEIQI